MAGIPVVIVLAAVVASRADQAAAAGSAAPAVALPSVPNLEQREWAIAVRMTHGASWSGGHRESSATG